MSESESLDLSDLHSIFTTCDVNGSGFIEFNDLKNAFPHLSETEIQTIILQLSSPGSDGISFQEFVAGYASLFDLFDQAPSPGDGATGGADFGASDEMLELEGFMQKISNQLKLLSGEDKVQRMYDAIVSAASSPMGDEGSRAAAVLAYGFEDLLISVLQDVQEAYTESRRLEEYIKRQREDHERQLRQLESDVEAQVDRAREDIRAAERKSAMEEIGRVRSSLQDEVRSLSDSLEHLHQIEQMYEDVQIERQNRETEFRREKVELESENQRLRINVAETETKMAVIKGDLASLKKRLQEKDQQLNVHNQAVRESLNTQENFIEQVQLLRDANHRLHDTNDDLRAALEAATGKQNIGKETLAELKGRRASVLGKYFNNVFGSIEDRDSKFAAEVPTNYNTTNKPHPSHTKLDSIEIELELMRKNRREQAITAMNILNGRNNTIYSGLSSWHTGGHGITEADENHYDMSSDDGGSTRVSQDSRRKRNYGSSRASSYSQDTASSIGTSISQKQPTNISVIHRTEPEKQEKFPVQSENTDNVSKATNFINSIAKTIAPTQTQRQYRVVLCGDTAVGKSCLFLRVCEDRFASNTQATLGVDFKTKNLSIDGQGVAIQLWDTAGQERFRSMARSYFRRADGVLLLYDSTDEETFLNVRHWVASVQEATDPSDPVVMMVLANKSDLIPLSKTIGRQIVPPDDGRRLAKEYGALFEEISAKTGDKVEAAIENLARRLLAKEDTSLKTTGMKLHEGPETKEEEVGFFSNCCSN